MLFWGIQNEIQTVCTNSTWTFISNFFHHFSGKHAIDQERPYFCVFCDIRFSTRKRWEKHMPKHSAEAPFDCKDCGKAFKWKHALTAHSVIHAPVKKFLCQECGFSTSHVSTFRFHNRIHSGNLTKCDVKNCTFQVCLFFPIKCIYSGKTTKWKIFFKFSEYLNNFFLT